jgi:hypothetical protein
MSECGYTPMEIRAMTLHDVGMLFRYWRKSPPTGALTLAIAVSLGMKPPSEKPAEEKKYMTADEFARMMAITGGRLE